ncbi:MAG: DUF4091 domain-containing protein, partial [Victivallaceae bacterium]|nr:DUF4091 domain-containing protein [Victivallaceae bacterium]
QKKIGSHQLRLAAGATKKISLPVTTGAEDTDFAVLLLDGKGRELFRSEQYVYSQKAVSIRLREREAFHNSAPAHPRLQALAEECVAVRSDWRKLEEFLNRTDAEIARFRFPVAGGKPELIRQKFYHYCTNSMEKISAGAPLSANRKLAASVSLDGAPGEAVNFQVGVVPLVPLVKQLTPKHFSFDKAIPGANLSVRREVEVDLGGGKLIPDFLSNLTTVDLAGEANSVMYFATVSIPKNLQAGIYQGKLVFEDESGAQSVCPIRLRVRSFRLPEQSPVLTFGDVEPFMASRTWRQTPEEIGGKIRSLAESYGVFPIRSVPLPMDLDRYHLTLEPEYRELAAQNHFVFAGAMPWIEWFPRFYIPRKDRKSPTTEAYFDRLIDEYTVIAKQLKKDGLLEKSYAYYDEIGIDQPEIRAILEKMKKRTGLKLMTCFDKPFAGTKYFNYYRDLVDFFIFNNSYFLSSSWCNLIRDLQKEGKKVCWYFNVSAPLCPTSFNVIDVPGVAQRMHYYKMYQYRIDATLFWSLHYHGRMDLTKRPLKTNMRGNGFLVYPENGEVLPSLRLEIVREGIQDIKYLHLAEQLAASHPAHPAAEKIRELLKLEWSGDITKVDVSPEQLLAFRAELADCIEQLNYSKER